LYIKFVCKLSPVTLIPHLVADSLLMSQSVFSQARRLPPVKGIFLRKRHIDWLAITTHAPQKHRVENYTESPLTWTFQTALVQSGLFWNSWMNDG